MNQPQIRLSKLMSERNICSRREADEFISKGWVYVDGLCISKLGTRVDSKARITLASEALKTQKNLITIILNKPIGYVSSQAEAPYSPAIVLLTEANYFGGKSPDFSPLSLENLAVAGRLDIDSQGLLIFTQDGRIAKSLIGSSSEVEKEYLVRFEGSVDEKKLEIIRLGKLKLDGDIKLKPAQVHQLNKDQLKFILKEGKKRQVRRMCEAIGLKVTGLKRVRVGKLVLGSLPEGKWRILKKNETFV